MEQAQKNTPLMQIDGMKLIGCRSYFDIGLQSNVLVYTFRAPNDTAYSVEIGGGMQDTQELRRMATMHALKCWKMDRIDDLRHAHPKKNPKGRRRHSPKPGKERRDNE